MLQEPFGGQQGELGIPPYEKEREKEPRFAFPDLNSYSVGFYGWAMLTSQQHQDS